MGLAKGNLTIQHKWLLAALLLLPLVVAAAKCPVLPTSDFVARAVSLEDVPSSMHRRLQYVLFVPLGALTIVFVRLTLGIRVLGPFRSILLAVAFQITGIIEGLLFLSFVVAAVATIRPTLKAMRLPYFGRVSVILSLMSVIIVATMLLGSWVDAVSLRRVAYFPIIVLCLLGDAFARTWGEEGPRSALWRALTTAMVGVALTWVSVIPGFRNLLMRYPELLVTQIGCIILICEYFDLRLLAWMNPAVDTDPEEDAPSVLGDKHLAA